MTVNEVDVRLTRMRQTFAHHELVSCGVLLREQLVATMCEATLAAEKMLKDRLPTLAKSCDIQCITVLVHAKQAFMEVEWPAVHEFSRCWSSATTFSNFLDAIHEQLKTLTEYHDVVHRLARSIRICSLYVNSLDLFAAHLPQLASCEHVDCLPDVLAWQAAIKVRICQAFCDMTSMELRTVFFRV